MQGYLPPPIRLGPPPQGPVARYAAIIALLRHYVGAATDRRWIAAPLATLIWIRLTRLGNRFHHLAVAIAAGTLPPTRRRPASPRRRQPRKVPDATLRLPAGRDWLLRLVQPTAAGKGWLQHLLDDPEMRALIAADPRVGRTVRPLCRMLGLALPPCLQLPPRPRRPRKPGPAPAPAPSPGASRPVGRLRSPTPQAGAGKARTATPPLPISGEGWGDGTPSPQQAPRPPLPAPEVARPAGVPPGLATA